MNTTSNKKDYESGKKQSAFSLLVTQQTQNGAGQKKAAVGKETCIQKMYRTFCRCFSVMTSQLTATINRKAVSLLPPQTERNRGRKTLVLDLDETLVHSSFQFMAKPDLKLDIVVDRTPITVLVKKRPGVERFLLKMAEFYEVVLFTASLRDYAVPVMDQIDPTKVCEYHLYRQSCTPYRNVLVKDMSLLGRNLKDSIIIDNSENSFMFQPMNAIHIKNFFEDETDTELDRLTPFLEFLSQVNDARPVHTWMETFDKNDVINYVNMQNQKDVWDKNSAKITEIVVDTPSTANDSALNLSRTRSRSSERTPNANGTKYIRRNSHDTYTQDEDEDYEEGPKEKDALLDHTSPPTSPKGKPLSANNKVESLRYINSGKNVNSPLHKGKAVSDLDV